MEETFFFTNERARLLGLLLQPDASTDRPGVVLCQPFAHEKAVAHRMLVDFARRLCAAGHPVLRFDYRGTGDSEGEFEETSLTSRLSDIRRATDVLVDETGCREVVLAGLRLGATLAAVAAPSDPRTAGLMLWEPLVDVGQYVDQVLRLQCIFDNSRAGHTVTTREQLVERMREEGAVDVLGFAISHTCYDQLSHVDVLAQASAYHGPTLIAGIGRQRRERKDLVRLAHAYRAGGGDVELVSVRKRPFWADPSDILREFTLWEDRAELFDRSLDWITAVGAEKVSQHGNASSL